MRTLVISPYLLLTFTPLLWASNIIVGKYTGNFLPPFTIALGRYLVATLILAPWFLRKTNLIILKDSKMRCQFLLLGLSITGFSGMMYLGLHYTTAINSAVITSFNPILTVLFAVFWLREKATLHQTIGIMVSSAGILWIASGGTVSALMQLDFNAGDLLVFAAQVLWSFYSVLGKSVMDRVSPQETTALSMCLAALMLIPFSAFEISRTPALNLGWHTLAALLYLAVFPAIVSFYWWLYGISKVGATRSAVFYNLTPVYGSILAVIFLGERLHVYQLIGGILVLAGIYYAAYIKQAVKTNGIAETG